MITRGLECGIVVCFLTMVLSSGCGGDGDDGFDVGLLAPLDGASEGLTVTFQWQIEGAKQGRVYCSEIITDKGVDPLDGSFEELLSAGKNTQLSVNLSPSRYNQSTFDWAVCVTACDDQNAVCADTASFGRRSSEPCVGSSKCSKVRRLRTSG